MEIVKPTLGSGNKIRLNQKNGINVFLAGSIEMGVAENWQDKIANIFKEYNITFLNPRRDEWDSTWVQSIENKMFRDQVEWELNGLMEADFTVMYFDPKTKSPISLLELGLMAYTGRIIVCCPDEFYRKANVEIVCNRFEIPIYNDWDEFVSALKHKFKRVLRNKEYAASHNQQ
jgi:hypothetical protein